MESDTDWMRGQFISLTDEIIWMRPSEWAEKNRYLEAAATALPGYYSYKVTPYLKEIVDCLDPRSPIREVSFMKSAQIGGTVGIIENGIGYLIGIVKTSPAMFLTADADLAKLRMEQFIMPMIAQSGLDKCIASSDEGNKRKTGKTAKKLQWLGGGFLIPFGARSGGKLRSVPIQVLFEDEPDAYPATLKGEGDPCKLAEARTSGTYSQTRKVFRVSTPTITETSRINRFYLQGDQRKYYVPCQGCGEMAVMKFQGKDTDTGEIWGITWERDEDGKLQGGSVRYVTKCCGYNHREGDKTAMLAGGEWRATAKPKSPFIRSYQISALYSPVVMLPWEELVREWLDVWDDALNQPKDMRGVQVFYNTKLGEPYSAKRRKIKLSDVAHHRRDEYRSGVVPNRFAERYGEGKIRVLTCAVDVHAHTIDVAVIGWGPGQRPYLVRYESIKGDVENSEEPWDELTKVIEGRYFGDDGPPTEPGNPPTPGTEYFVPLTFIDYPYLSDKVAEFCARYLTNDSPCVVLPTMGKTQFKKNTIVKEFAKVKTSHGLDGYNILVDAYKDRWERQLRRPWRGDGPMPQWQLSVPRDLDDAKLSELTKEYRRAEVDSSTGDVIRYVWHRPKGSRNELWDLLVYNTAALEVLALEVCMNGLDSQAIVWDLFWQTLAKERPFECV